mmetsp:Transcript_46308/g.61303  ORF Transcript_46308/g.61303 Transcript_46308/m.61303 type:complete len:114 (+) Transcript_46308:200-541(+)
MRAGLHMLQSSLNREHCLAESKTDAQWKQVEQQVLANELYSLCADCNIINRLPIILTAEAAMRRALDLVYASSLLKFLRVLIKKSAPQEDYGEELSSLCSLARTILITLGQQE